MLDAKDVATEDEDLEVSFGIGDGENRETKEFRSGRI